MIHEYKTKKRILFFPTAWANSITRWILGVFSSDGSVLLKNTANPGDKGSLDMRVNMEYVMKKVEERLGTRDMSDDERKRVKEIMRGVIDGVSLVWQQEHMAVSMKWLEDEIIKLISKKLPQPEEPTNPTQLSSGRTSGVNLLDQSAMDFTADGNAGCTLLMVSRCNVLSSSKLQIIFRTVKVSSDGRIASIGPEIAAAVAYPG